jgi:hypothetical protein
MSTVMTTVRLMSAPGMRTSLPAEAGGAGGAEVALVLVFALDELELTLEVDVVVDKVEAALESEDSRDDAPEEIEEATEDADDLAEENAELSLATTEDALLDAAPDVEEAALLMPLAVTGATTVTDDPDTIVV